MFLQKIKAECCFCCFMRINDQRQYGAKNIERRKVTAGSYMTKKKNRGEKEARMDQHKP